MDCQKIDWRYFGEVEIVRRFLPVVQNKSSITIVLQVRQCGRVQLNRIGTEIQYAFWKWWRKKS